MQMREYLLFEICSLLVTADFLPCNSQYVSTDNSKNLQAILLII